MYSHFFTKIIREEKILWRKEQNDAEWIQGATEIKPNPFPVAPWGAQLPRLISGLMRYNFVNIPEIICRHIAALAEVPVQQSELDILNCYSGPQLKTWNIHFNLVTAPSLLALINIANVQLWAFSSAVRYFACIVISCIMSSINTVTPSSEKALLCTNKWHYLDNCHRHNCNFTSHKIEPVCLINIINYLAYAHANRKSVPLGYYLSKKIVIYVILDTMMSPPTLSTHKFRIWTAGFLFKLFTLEDGTDKLYQNVAKELPLSLRNNSEECSSHEITT
jgi:hypothetical protein